MTDGREAAKMRADRGSDAVKLSKQQNEQQSNMSLAPSSKSVLVANTMSNQFVGTKNFYNQSGVWQDAEFKAEKKLPEISVKYGSEEFYALLNKEKELAQFLALGEQVVVVWNGNVYRIVK